jgi:2-oxoglutarate ferredoxin oxidoreductase subunit alpha
LEKDYLTGNVSYDPVNHERQVRTRAAKVAGIAAEIPPTVVNGPESGDLLVVGWGSTYGAITQAVTDLRKQGQAVSSVHLRYLNPLPPDLGDLLRRFRRVLVPELNLGQLSKVLRATYLVDCVGLNKVQGKPFMIRELSHKMKEVLAA